MNEPTLEPIILTRVLLRLGWERVGSFRESVAYWEPADSASNRFTSVRDERILFPLATDAPDFDDLLEEVTFRLRARHGEDFVHEEELVRLLIQRRLDEIDVKRETDNAAGLIRWQTGNQMVESARGLLGAAARAANLPRKRFAQAQSTIAEAFLQSCYMGQTRVGSYVVTALTPAGQTFATSRAVDANSKKHPRITGRQITATLVNSLSAVREAIEVSKKTPDGDIAAFEEQIMAGVSFELLASLEPLTADDESAIVIEYNDIEQTSLLPSPQQRVEFAFTPEDGKTIARAKSFFEAAPEPTHVVMSGEVTFLKNSQSDSEHQIRLHTRLHGKPRSVVVNLSAEQYDSAVRAHGAKVMITVMGELEQKTRGSIVERPENVRIESTPVSVELPASTDTPLWETEASDD